MRGNISTVWACCFFSVLIAGLVLLLINERGRSADQQTKAIQQHVQITDQAVQLQRFSEDLQRLVLENQDFQRRLKIADDRVRQALKTVADAEATADRYKNAWYELQRLQKESAKN